MLKLSFKNNDRDPCKVTRYFNGKVTVVTLKGTVVLPKELLPMIPLDIFAWIGSRENIDARINVYGVMQVSAIGKAACSPDDAWSSRKGERIAEARARMKLYVFMKRLIRKMVEGMLDVAIGEHIVVQRKERREKNSLQDAYMKYDSLVTKELIHLHRIIHADTEST